MVGRTAAERRGPPEPVNPAAADLADARERILLTAHELFRRHGVTAVGVDRIVAEANVAKTTLYRHFRSKDELVLGVLDRHGQVWSLGWLESEAMREATPVTRLLAIFDLFDDWFRQETYQGCLFTNTLLENHERSGPIQAAAVARMTDVRTWVSRVAEEAGVADPAEFALRAQLLMWGSIVGALNGQIDAARSARAVAVMLLEQSTGS
jgi:AcrR family transcriptional regulator